MDDILDLIDGAIARNGDAMRWRPPNPGRLAMDATLAMWRRKCRWGEALVGEPQPVASFETERWSDPT